VTDPRDIPLGGAQPPTSGGDKAREDMVARQRLIQAMIDNNLRQLKFETARGGAEIERACALRDCERDAADAKARAELAAVDQRLEELEEEHRRLVAEREWLNQSLLEFDDKAAGQRSLS
jgi:hypothetical protein